MGRHPNFTSPYVAMPTSRASPDPVQGFHALWREGAAPDWRAFLDGLGDVGRDVLLDVVRIDQRARWERGQRVLVETYLSRLPELRGDGDAEMDLLYGEICLRDDLGDAPTLEEYVARFPAKADALRRQFEVHRLFASEEPETAATLKRGPANDDRTLAEKSGARHELGDTIAEDYARDGAEPPLGLLGEYELLSEIDRGGMGIVYRARHRKMRRIVALKMIQSSVTVDGEQRARFRLEYESLAQLNHPHVIQIFDVGDREGQPYFTMELADGGSLAKRINGQPQPPRDAAALVAKLAEAVATVHQRGILHRDLKPANVLLFRPPNAAKSPEGLKDWLPKLTDFGLAKFDPDQIRAEGDQTRQSQRTRTGVILGTPSYMAPEQAEGKTRELTPATDTYALGAILYELLTGRPPFMGESSVATLQLLLTVEPVPPRRLQPTTPRDLETICLRCLHKEPHRRYATAQALADDLNRFLRGEPIQARPVGTTEKAIKWVRRHPTESLLAATILGLLLAGAVGILVAWKRAERDYRDLRAAWDEKEASEREAEAQRQARELDRYYRSIDFAEREWRYGQTQALRAFLDDCPERHRGWEWRYLDRLWRANDWLAATRDQASGPGHVTSVAYSPDGRYLASGCFDAGIDLWDAATLRHVRTMVDPGGPVLALAWQRGSEWLATGARDHGVSLWNAKTGECVRRLEGHEDIVTHVAFSHRGDLLASASIDRTARLFDVKTGRCLRVLEGHQDGVTFVAFSPNDDLLAAAAKDGTILLWDLGSQAEPRPLVGHVGSVTALCFLPTRRVLVSAGRDHTLKLWDLATGREIETLRRHGADLVALAVNGTGELLASAAGDLGSGEIKVWKVDDWEEAPGPRGHPRGVIGMAFHPRTDQLAIASKDEPIRIWNPEWGAEARLLVKFPKAARAVAFHPRRPELAVAGYFPNVETWDWRGRQLLETLTGHGGWVNAVAYSPDGGWLASASDDGAVLLRRTEPGSAPVERKPRFGAVNALAFSHDGRRLAGGGEDQIVHVWHVGDDQRLELTGHDAEIRALAFHPHLDLLASADTEGSVFLWDLRTGERRVIERAAGRQVLALAFSGDGECLAAASGAGARGEVRLWDVATGKTLRDLLGHQGMVLSLAFLPGSGDRLATGGGDRAIILWDWRTGYQALTLRGHAMGVAGLAFDPSGRVLASAGEDGEVRLWANATDETPPQP